MRVLITMEVGLQIEGPRIMPLEQKIDLMIENGVITISELEGRMRTEESSYFY